MRAVIDTNVLISGLLWRGQPQVLLEQVRAGNLTMVSSPVLLAELADVIGRAKFDVILARSNTARDGALAEIRRFAQVFDPPPLPLPVCRDPDDDHVLALAVAIRADFVVSGDDDLLSLASFEGIPIVNPGKALVLIAARR